MYVPAIPPNDITCCGERNQYTQCRLAKDGRAEYVSWIPTEFAIPGKVVKLKFGQVWEDGWRVIGAGATKMGLDKELGVLCECGW